MMRKIGKYENVLIVKKLSRTLRMYAKVNKISFEELAFKMNITPRQFRNIVNCNSICKIDTLEKIQRVIKCDLNELYNIPYSEGSEIDCIATYSI